ncbi:MAG: hypothetical protein HRT44_10300, partial [Bdellovibrionales bacterium]|nr:hypothetical protein [Bdellovibrionales bacterium]
MNVDIEITSVRILVDAFLIYGHCIHSHKRRSIFIKKQFVFKEPLIAEVWQFNCSSASKFINFIPQYASTEGILTLAGLASVDSELELFERTGKPCTLPSLTNRLFLKHPKFRGIGCGQERIKKAIKEVCSARKFLTEMNN